MKIAIAGSGALGSGFGAKLFQHGYDVTLIDNWEPQVTAIQQDGLHIDINGEAHHFRLPMFRLTEIPKETSYDIVFLFPKSMQLEEVLSHIQPHIHDNTIVVCTMNGLKHERLIQQYVSIDRIVRGVTTWTAGIDQPGHTHLMGQGPVEIGCLLPEGKENVDIIVNLLQNTELKGVKSEHLHQSIWKKICVNGTANSLCTILECNLAALNNSEDAKNLIYKITQEIVHVATIDDVHLNVDEIFDYLIALNDKVGPHYPSMYQDLIKDNRTTEIDYINGAVSKLGKENHIATPVNDFVTNLIHAKESQRGAQ